MKRLEQELELGAPILLSVNLSCRQFARPSLVKSIKEILRQTEFSPGDLRIEITESVFFEYQESADEMLRELSAMGIELNVDDFGTGYSNLSHLMRLPISRLKIDKSFVGTIGRSSEDIGLVRAIVSLARTLGLKVVAEGVENTFQLEELKRLDCDAAQGFLFAEPMTIEELERFLTRDEQPHLLQQPSISQISIAA
jgi:EAL domain-containing protein (putative c-di-GMP-specific phosphodiesterase class I)